MCGQLCEGLVEAGLSREEARSRIVICTAEGALGKVPEDGRRVTKHASGAALTWVNDQVNDGASILECVKTFKPTLLLGTL